MRSTPPGSPDAPYPCPPATAQPPAGRAGPGIPAPGPVQPAGLAHGRRRAPADPRHARALLPRPLRPGREQVWRPTDAGGTRVAAGRRRVLYAFVSQLLSGTQSRAGHGAAGDADESALGVPGEPAGADAADWQSAQL